MEKNLFEAFWFCTNVILYYNHVCAGFPKISIIQFLQYFTDFFTSLVIFFLSWFLWKYKSVFIVVKKSTSYDHIRISNFCRSEVQYMGRQYICNNVFKTVMFLKLSTEVWLIFQIEIILSMISIKKNPRTTIIPEVQFLPKWNSAKTKYFCNRFRFMNKFTIWNLGYNFDLWTKCPMIDHIWNPNYLVNVKSKTWT